jgi:DNA-binding CsgD family transcriptional regulator
MIVRVTPRALTSSDYDSLLDVAAAVAAVRDPDEFARVVPVLVPELVASDATSLNDVDPAARVVRAVVMPESFRIPVESAQALEELAGQHPLIRHMSETGDGSAIKISDFWSVPQWHDSEVYARVYAPMGVEHQMALSLPARRPVVIGLALNRVTGGSDFSERDRAVLDRLRPHLAQSWRNAREHARVRILLASAAGALEATDSAVLLLGSPPHELTPGALTTLYRFFGRPSAHSPLPARVAQWLERERANAAGLRLSRPLSATRESRHVIARYLPAIEHGVDGLVLRTSVVGGLSSRLARLGLSAREAEILELLTTGASNALIAQRLGLAPATVKRHIENIYRKLGVSGRVQACAVALSIINAD